MAEADQYVTDLVIARLSKRDARRAFVVDDTATKAAETELARLEAQLAEALQLYLDDKLSATAYSAKEQKLKPAVVDARRRARPSGAPLAVLELLSAARAGKEFVRPAWERLTLLARREVIAAVFATLTLRKPNGVHINRWILPEERYAIVAARIDHEFRTATT